MLVNNNTPFEMVRLSHSKREVDTTPNQIRFYAKHGLRLYRLGKAVYFSRIEFADFIRRNADNPSLKRKKVAA